MVIKVTAPVRIDISAGWPDSDPFRKEFGGAVLNAAINLRVSAEFQGVNLITSLCDVPPSSGLGTSGALRAAYIAASNPKLIEDKSGLIRRVHMFENQVLGQRAGFQDEAAAIYGGVKYWEFKESGGILYTNIPIEKARHLQDRIVIVDTGASHLSSNIHELVFGPGNYERNMGNLFRMKEIAREMKNSIADEKEIKRLINETWILQRNLHESIETDLMKELQKKLKGKYLAARATGAGGGGCMIFYTQDKKELARAVNGLEIGARVLPFEFDYKGLVIES